MRNNRKQVKLRAGMTMNEVSSLHDWLHSEAGTLLEEAEQLLKKEDKTAKDKEAITIAIATSNAYLTVLGKITKYTGGTINE